jgi:putative SOS response-associated peptidase YedK
MIPYMCGRYTLTIDKSTIEKRFGATFYVAQAGYDYEATYNAAPSHMLPIIRTYAPDRIELARWGFWSEERKRSKHLHAMINARSEAAAVKPMFAMSFSLGTASSSPMATMNGAPPGNPNSPTASH